MSQEKNANKKTYTCPMHPEVQTDQPGTSPKCGMELVEKNISKKTKTHE